MTSNLNNKKKEKNKELSEDEDTKRLLEYYRLRIKGITKEIIDWLKNLEGINIENENFHEKEWELNKLNEKINQLQQSLSQANLALNNERRRIIAFNSEIDTFKSKYLNYFYLFL
jgi:chromosome segregation ATPase